MTVKMTEIVMRVPLAGGRFCFIVFDPTVTPDFAPLHVLNGARMAQPTAPLFLKPLKENGAGAPLLHSAPTSSQEWRKPSPSGEFLGVKKPTLQDDLTDVLAALAEKSSAMACLDTKLGPVRDEEQRIKAAILATHETRNGVIHLDVNRGRERVPYFERLTALAREWGPLREERRQLNGEVKGLEKQADRLRNLIQADANKKRKA